MLSLESTVTPETGCSEIRSQGAAEFDDLVDQCRTTQVAYPMMKSGKLRDGTHFSFVYQSSTATLRIDEWNQYASIDVDGDVPGWLRDDQFRKVFVEVYQKVLDKRAIV